MLAYETFKGIADGEEFGSSVVLDDARLRFPQWAELYVMDRPEFIAFAGHFCGLSPSEPHAMYEKHAAWNVLQKLTSIPDEEPH